MSRRARIVLLVLATFGAVAVVGGWLGRDRPRRWLEATLSARLDATVSIGSVDILGPRRARLRNLVVQAIPYQPRVRHVRAGMVLVEGDFGDIRAGRVARLTMRDVEIHLDTRPPAGPVPPMPPSTAKIGRLTVHDARLSASAGDGDGDGDGAETSLSLLAAFDDIGGAMHGSASLRGTDLDLAPLLEGFGGIEARPSSVAGLVRLDAEVDWRSEVRTIDLAALLPGVLAAAGRWAVPPQDAPAGRLDIDLRTVDLVPWAAALQAHGLIDAVGTADIEVHGPLTGPVDVRAAARLETAALRVDLDRDDPDHAPLDVAFEDIGASASGRLWLDAPMRRFTGSVRATAERSRAARARVFDLRGEQLELELEFEAAGDQVLAKGQAEAARMTFDAAGGQGELDAVLAPIDATLMRTANGWRGSMNAAPKTTVLGATLDRDDLPIGTLPATLDGVIAIGFGAPVEAAASEVPTAGGSATLATAALGTLQVRGDVRLGAAPDFDIAWRLQEVGVGRWSSAVLGDLGAGVDLTGTLSARGRSRGNRDRLQTDGTIEIGDLVARSADWQLDAPDLVVDVSWGSLDGQPRLRLADQTVRLHVGATTPVEAQIDASLIVDPTEAIVRFREARLDAGPLGVVDVVGTIGTGLEADLELDLGGIDVATWLARGPEIGAPAWPPAYQPRGVLAARLEVDRLAEGPWTARGPVTLSGAGFADDDGARVLEDLHGEVELDASVDAAGTTVSAVGGLGGFLLLWDAVFADYAEHRAAIRLDARTTSTSDGLSWQVDLDASLPAPGARLEAAIHRGPTGPLGYRFRLVASDLGTVLERDLKTPFQGSYPPLDRMVLDGAARVDSEGTWDGAVRTASGALHLDQVRVALAEAPIEADGLALALPFDLRWRQQPDGDVEVDGLSQSGSLRFAHLVAGGISFEPAAAALETRGDTVRVVGELAGPILGGRLSFRDLALVELLRPGRHLQTAIELDGADVGLAAEAFGLPPLTGRLDGSFPSIRLTRSTFEVDGDSTLDVFGGRVTVRDITGRDMLTRYPRLRFSADLENIDLAAVTATVDFGSMSGHVEGALRDCELFRGLPVRCRGHLASIDDRRDRRTIDVKAINNIAILGTGGRASALDRSLLRFLDRFTYEKLGLEITLRQDRFSLRGLEHRGRRELFVKGTLPFPIDVVNVKPGNTVSFQTMLDRLRHLDRAQVSTGPPGSKRKGEEP